MRTEICGRGECQAVLVITHAYSFGVYEEMFAVRTLYYIFIHALPFHPPFMLKCAVEQLDTDASPKVFYRTFKRENAVRHILGFTGFYLIFLKQAVIIRKFDLYRYDRPVRLMLTDHFNGYVLHYILFSIIEDIFVRFIENG